MSYVQAFLEEEQRKANARLERHYGPPDDVVVVGADRAFGGAVVHEVERIYVGVDHGTDPASTVSVRLTQDGRLMVRPATKPFALTLTSTEAMQAIWPHLAWKANKSVSDRVYAFINAEGERLRLTEEERAMLYKGQIRQPRDLWMARTGRDEDLWKEAQGHAWRTMRETG